jgi:hypothetical protein
MTIETHDLHDSSVFRSVLSVAQSPTQRDPIILADPWIEQSWVLESLLDVVYDLEFTCLDDYYRARGVIDLAEKWSFDHVIVLIKHHFHHAKDEPLSAGRFNLALALKDEEQVIGWVKACRTGTWGNGSLNKQRTIGAATSILNGEPYIHDQPVSTFLGHKTITGGDIFDLGTWGYQEFLHLSPTTAWAILRARQKAITSKCVIDGQVFEDEFAKLLKIIMAVSSITDMTSAVGRDLTSRTDPSSRQNDRRQAIRGT